MAEFVGLGIDSVEVERFSSVLVRRPRIVARLFTLSEQDYCEGRVNSAQSYAVRFAAKEAVMKALGVGIGQVDWHEIEVGRGDGAPSVSLTGRAAKLAERRGVTYWVLSLTHTANVATAAVVGTR